MQQKFLNMFFDKLNLYIRIPHIRRSRDQAVVKNPE